MDGIEFSLLLNSYHIDTVIINLYRNLSIDKIKEAIGSEEDAQEVERRFLREPEVLYYI